MKLTVRIQGPYDPDVPVQVVCYFKHREAGDTTLGAAVELDRKLGGVIASLRGRREFAGDELETLLLIPPEGTIKPKALLLIGLGDEKSLSLDRMERVGRVALREATRLGVAPQGTVVMWGPVGGPVIALAVALGASERPRAARGSGSSTARASSTDG